MKLTELKEIIDHILQNGMRDDYEVSISIKGQSIGPSPAATVKSAGAGIDWDASRFFLFPEQDLVKDTAENAHWEAWKSKAINLLYSISKDERVVGWNKQAEKIFNGRIPTRKA
jgi:hypothetical protein